MKRLVLVYVVLISISGFSQQPCSVVKASCWDTASYRFVVLPQQLVNKYQNSKKGAMAFFARQTTSGCWVTMANALDEFADYFSEYNLSKGNVQYTWLTRCNFPDASPAPVNPPSGGSGGGTTTATTMTPTTGGIAFPGFIVLPLICLFGLVYRKQPVI